jgi:hypothetical protein
VYAHQFPARLFLVHVRFMREFRWSFSCWLHA